MCDRQAFEAARWAAEHCVGAVMAIVNEAKRGGDIGGCVGHLAHCIAEADRDLLPQLEHIRARRPETDPVPWAGVRSATAHDSARNAAMHLFCTIHNACMKRGDTHALTPDVVRARAGSKMVRETVMREYGRSDLDHEAMTARLDSEAAHWSAGLATDGPLDGDSFAWGDKVCRHLSKRLYDLLVYFWDDGKKMRSATYGELVERVWGTDEDGTSWSAVKSAASRLDTALSEEGVFLGIHTSSERHVYVEWTSP